ncbi:MAG: MATE family efflux transporter [SAR324 cluster bacterium]|nr:MATE family efflux transporter [SAR324 cluster bacterium]
MEGQPAAQHPPPAAGWALLRHHLGATGRLAGPVMIARSGALIMITSDVIMTGRAGARELAYYGLGFAPAQNLFVIGIGFLMGAMVLTAQAQGRGELPACATIWYVAMLHGLLAGLGFMALALGGEWFFRVTGQAPDLAAGGAGVLRMMALGLPGVMLYLATAQFMDGLSRPKANMVLMLFANLINILLNWLLIYGHGDFRGMGAEGAALATSITRWLMWIGLAGYVLLMPGARRYGVLAAPRGAREVSRKMIRMGLPVGLAHGLEASAFTAIVILAGRLGALQLATYQIAQNLFVNAYMLAIGLATATSVRVGNAVGRRERNGVAWAGWTGLGMGAGVLLCVSAAYQVFAQPLAGFYSTHPSVLELAYPAIAVAAYFVVADGIQGVAVGALRGTGDVWMPTMLVACGFWGISLPMGYVTAFNLGWGVDGLLWGLAAGALAAAILLLWRFAAVARREVAPL